MSECDKNFLQIIFLNFFVRSCYHISLKNNFLYKYMAAKKKAAKKTVKKAVKKTVKKAAKKTTKKRA